MALQRLDYIHQKFHTARGSPIVAWGERKTWNGMLLKTVNRMKLLELRVSKRIDKATPLIIAHMKLLLEGQEHALPGRQKVRDSEPHKDSMAVSIQNGLTRSQRSPSGRRTLGVLHDISPIVAGAAALARIAIRSLISHGNGRPAAK